MSARNTVPAAANPFVGDSLDDTAYRVGCALSCLAELPGLAVGHDDGLLLDNRQSYGLQMLLLTLTEALNAHQKSANGDAQ